MPGGGKLIEDAPADVVRTNTGAAAAGAVIDDESGAGRTGLIRVDPDGVRLSSMAGKAGNVAFAVGAIPTTVQHEGDDRHVSPPQDIPRTGDEDEARTGLDELSVGAPERGLSEVARLALPGHARGLKGWRRPAPVVPCTHRLLASHDAQDDAFPPRREQRPRTLPRYPTAGAGPPLLALHPPVNVVPGVQV